jgi:hypothetical protein
MANSNLAGPTYYKRGTVEVWDFIRDQQLNYHLGNAVKYISRAGFKDSKIDDLKKAIHYLQNELENEITSQRSGKGVPVFVSSSELQDTCCPDYAPFFDR